jgi:hypothetical protein
MKRFIYSIPISEYRNIQLEDRFASLRIEQVHMRIINVERKLASSVCLRTWVETSRDGLPPGSQVDEQFASQVLDHIDRRGDHGAVLCTGRAEGSVLQVLRADTEGQIFPFRSPYGEPTIHLGCHTL